MPGWIALISWTTKGILLLLAGLSVWSISIMLERLKVFRSEDNVRTADAMAMIKARDLEGLKRWAGESTGVRARVARVLSESSSASTESIQRGVQSEIQQTRIGLEKGMTVLGSLGSNAPFIGLFGTVLGIIQAFGALSFQQGNMALVMASIAEALVATAIGLFVAVPAVISYNYFARRLRLVLNDCEAMRDYFISIYKR